MNTVVEVTHGLDLSEGLATGALKGLAQEGQADISFYPQRPVSLSDSVALLAVRMLPARDDVLEDLCQPR